MAEQLRKVMQDKKLEIAITPFGVDIQKFDLKCYVQKSDKTEIINLRPRQLPVFPLP